MIWLARYQSRALVKSGLVPEVVSALCRMAAEAADDDEDDDEDASVPHKCATQALDGLAMSVPAKHVLPTALAFCKQVRALPPRSTLQSLQPQGVWGVCLRVLEQVSAKQAQVPPNGRLSPAHLPRIEDDCH